MTLILQYIVFVFMYGGLPAETTFELVAEFKPVTELWVRSILLSRADRKLCKNIAWQIRSLWEKILNFPSLSELVPKKFKSFQKPYYDYFVLDWSARF